MNTYLKRYDEGGQSAEMVTLIQDRGEDPAFAGADDVGNEVYRFGDGTEVIVTNAGVVAENDDGFAALRAACIG